MSERINHPEIAEREHEAEMAQRYNPDIPS